MQLGPQLRTPIALVAQSIDRFVLRQFGMTDLGLKIMCECLHIRQRSFSPLAGRSLGRQRSFGALQPAAGGRRRARCAAMRRQFVALIPAQHCDRNIPVLDEATPVQPAVEPVTHSMGRFRSFRFGPMALSLAQKAEGFSHLRLGLINRLGFAAGSGLSRPAQTVSLVFASEIFEAKF
jgi:hypothetical protein